MVTLRPQRSLLHDPSFTTTKARNRACADTTNPCTARVMANAFNRNGILFDHCSRREVVDSFVYYTKDILACHEGHLSQIRNNMQASVEIVYGIPTWERQYLLQNKLQALDLWGPYEGITIYLEYKNVQENFSETSRRLRRFLISAFHSQNIIRAWSPPKYVERRLRCNNCRKFRRFLLINADLESLPDVTIQSFYRGSHGFSEGDQLLMLQQIPSAARNHR